MGSPSYLFDFCFFRIGIYRKAYEFFAKQERNALITGPIIAFAAERG